MDAEHNPPGAAVKPLKSSLEGIEKIKREVDDTGLLNKAYIPILQSIAPGELQSAENAMKFARILVRDWLVKYKFKRWTHRARTGETITEDYKIARAEEIASRLCNHRLWLTHGRSLKIEDLEDMQLQIIDYTKIPELGEAIRRYYTLLHMTFATPIYKVFETPQSQIYRVLQQGQVSQEPIPQIAQPGEQDTKRSSIPSEVVMVGFVCQRCGTKAQIQANLDHPHPLRQGCIPFPTDNKFLCPKCLTENDLEPIRQQIEAQSGQHVID